jgi:hypothetical protein
MRAVLKVMGVLRAVLGLLKLLVAVLVAKALVAKALVVGAGQVTGGSAGYGWWWKDWCGS